MLLHLGCGKPAPAVPAPAAHPPASAVAAASPASAPPRARGAARMPSAGKAAHEARGAQAEARRRSSACRVHACALPILPPWPSGSYRYSTSGATLAEALRALSTATHVPIAFAPDLPGRVEGRFDMSPQRFVEALARAYGLVWYYDGAVLHVDAAGAQTTLIVRLNYARRADLHALLARTGIDDVRFTARDDAPSRGLVTFRGPPAWIALVARAAQQLDAEARARVTTAVRIVPLHYGSAADRTAFANDRTNIVRGVASRAARLLDPHDSLRADIIEYEAPLPVLSADARTNSVLVRDRPERLDADVRAIAALDRPQQSVGIALFVTDTDVGTLRALGLGTQGTVIVRGREASGVAAALRGSHGVRVLADSELQTVDGVAVAWQRRAERPVVVMRERREAAGSGSTGASGAGSTPNAHGGERIERVERAASAAAQPPAEAADAAPDENAAGDGALRIVPTLDARAGSPRVVLAVEWRGTAIDVARAALGPGDALVMVEPAGAASTSASEADRVPMRVIFLAPHAIDHVDDAY
ncbi:hypothetical protein Busp01_19590 [Trinickia caryophylli]|uniref:Type II/III secretion system short domain-containing protein n=2 Tax=Trinickia caryophylli TaxID=28094 RepID=A0A1X7EDA4_TRICW|nr:hypothetical protein Busp01_19590 [Trinickia caryophylli]SMF31972.1 type II/III secretion system short domain-containing protein [Trinickia caryophylli]